MSNNLIFEPKARILLQLGDQLIRSESIALLELVKNSYDANASLVKVYLKNVDIPDEGKIVIIDDGIGMNADIIKNVWMQPGTNYKLKILQSMKEPLPSQRIPIGDKGIGRFGVHKLGYRIELVSKMSDSKEVYLSINWRDFDKDDFLKNISVTLEERDNPVLFTEGKTGTSIVIKDLRTRWTRGAIRELYRSINSLNSPFSTMDSFKVYFNIDRQEWLSGLLTFKEIEEHALYYADAIIDGNEIKTLEYEFRPWDTMKKLKGRKLPLKNIRMVGRVRNEETQRWEQKDIDLSDYKIGPIHFKVLIFDRSPKILSLGVSDKKGFREYLNTNGGIRVFRNDIRIYDYGELSNDWLGLDIKRVNFPSETISNNIVIGAASLDRTSSTDLVEKTNREGFVENEAYRTFSMAVHFTLGKILTQRNLDKDKVRKFYSPSSISEPVMGNLKVLQDKIENGISSNEFRDDLVKTIKDIEQDYKTVIDIYTRSSSAGLSLGIVIHEVDKIIAELVTAVEELPSHEHITSLVKILHKTVSDYAGVLRQSTKTREDLVEIIDQSLSNIQFRIKAHHINVIRKYQTRTNLATVVRCAPNLVISTIMNIIDNSIWWQNYANVTNKKILIDITEEYPGYTSVLIADNGTGFSIPTEDAVKPFISDKPGGMGLGLHLASEVMNGHKGEIVFPEPDDFILPSEFKQGAKLLLAFKR
ncbi:ATP-binding protein [bacterium]|nr:ATP-binding protein [bacterium]MBU1063402.1 ATP-binding protein [bacterium]MBU1635255.1 ATP-binding protein [bacterium]MBU1872200.1 ATP-binding protein [bacterium]